MYKLFLSLRFLKTRIISYVAVVGMAIGVLALVTVLSVMNGFQREFRARIRGTQAHLTVDTPRFFGMKDWRRVRKALLDANGGLPAATPKILAVAPFIRNIVLVKGPTTKDYGFIQGVLPEVEAEVGELKDYVLSPMALARTINLDRLEFIRGLQRAQDMDESDPKFLSPKRIEERLAALSVDEDGKPLPDTVELAKLFTPRKTELPGLIVGLEFMKFYHLEVGSTVTLLTTSDVEKDLEEIESRTQRFEVTGVFKTGIWDVDRRTCMAHLETTQDFILGNRDAVTGLHARVEDFTRVSLTAAALEKALNKDDELYAMSLRVETWESQNRQLLLAVDMEKRLLWFILFFMIVVAGMNIISILSMSVVEKTKDLGIIRAVGGTGAGVLTIFLNQGLVIGALGSGIGTGLGLLLVHYINEVADTIEVWTGYHPFPHNIYYLDRIPALVDYPLIAWIVLPTVSVSILFALYPAWRAGRMDPIEALRYE